MLRFGKAAMAKCKGVAVGGDGMDGGGKEKDNWLDGMARGELGAGTWWVEGRED